MGLRDLVGRFRSSIATCRPERIGLSSDGRQVTVAAASVSSAVEREVGSIGNLGLASNLGLRRLSKKPSVSGS